MRDHKSGHSSYEKKATEVNVPGHSDKIFSLLFISSWIVGSYELQERERDWDSMYRTSAPEES